MLVLFSPLLVGCVVAETCGYGSSDPTPANPGVNGCGAAGSRVEVQNGIALCWSRQMTSIGQVVDTRVLGELDKRSGSRVTIGPSISSSRKM